MAIITSVEKQDREYGTALSGFLTTRFAVDFLIRLVIMGLIGGMLFGWSLERFLKRK